MKSFLKRIIAKSGFEIVRTNKNSTKIKGGVYLQKKQFLVQNVKDYLFVTMLKSSGTKKVILKKSLMKWLLMAASSKNTCILLKLAPGLGDILKKFLAGVTSLNTKAMRPQKIGPNGCNPSIQLSHMMLMGVSLKETPSKSVDLTHAHGVFVYLPFLVSYQYFKEIIRITKIGGSVCFDIISEDCLDEPTVEKWLKSGQNYPCFISTEYVVSLFEQYGFGLSGTFINRYGEGLSNYIVFKRKN
jgi:hypothetical protein